VSESLERYKNSLELISEILKEEPGVNRSAVTRNAHLLRQQRLATGSVPSGQLPFRADQTVLLSWVLNRLTLFIVDIFIVCTCVLIAISVSPCPLYSIDLQFSRSFSA
jgi:hypothetical protein